MADGSAGIAGSEAAPRILWYDDQIDHFDAHVEILREHNMIVDPVDETNKCVERAQSAKYDLIIMDERLNGPSGTEVVTQLVQQGHATKFLIFSAYIEADHVDLRLQTLAGHSEIEISLLAKSDVPAVSAAEFVSRFVEPVARLATGGDPKGTAVTRLLPDPSNGGIRYDDFVALDIDSQADVVDQFYLEHAEVIQEEFAAGAAWICFFGNSDRPAIRADSLRAIPAYEDIEHRAQAFGLAPFSFLRPGRIESIQYSPLSCSSERNMRGYPVLSFEVDQNVERCHFDNGTFLNRFDAKFLTSKGLMRPTSSMTREDTNIGFLYGELVTFRCLFEEDGGKTFLADVNCFAIKKNFDNLISVECFTDCRNRPEYAPGRRCVYRNGLFGRQVMEENGVEYSVSSRDCHVRLRKEK